jgi:hypothetical protein
LAPACGCVSDHSNCFAFQLNAVNYIVLGSGNKTGQPEGLNNMNQNAVTPDGDKKQPAVIAFPRPFRLIQFDKNDKWSPTLKDINENTYDYVKLHKVITGLDIGLEKPFSLLFNVDSALVLPALPAYRDPQQSLVKFNEVLGLMTLGGTFFHALEPADIGFAFLYFETGYVRYLGGATSRTAMFHAELRSKLVGGLGNIDLLNPDTLTARQILDSYKKGKSIHEKIPVLSPFLLLNGISAFVAFNWPTCLTNLWTCAEQLISFIWEKEIINGSFQPTEEIKGRRDFLNDHRTWTSSASIELVFQRQLIDTATYKKLQAARKARNDFAHKGALPKRQDAENVFDSVFFLLSLIVTNYRDSSSLTELCMRYKALSESKSPQRLVEVSEGEVPEGPPDGVSHWRYTPPVPGESHWDNKEQ